MRYVGPIQVVVFTALCDQDGCDADVEWEHRKGAPYLDDRGNAWCKAGEYVIRCEGCGT